MVAWAGEFFREAAVLVAVLAPMELLVQHGTLTGLQSGIIVAVTVFCLGFGFYAGLDGDDDE